VRVLALEATAFRNLAPLLVEPHPRFNVFFGNNGQGKTNLLEAIYLLGTLRSFRAGKTEELIGFGQTQARVRARVERLGTEQLLEVALTPGHKSARVDGKSARAAHYFGGFNVVLFAPEDLRLVRGAPSGRRRFLDRAIFNAHPGYLTAVQTYERVLRSRNALLRMGRALDTQQLEIYDQQLVATAEPLWTQRRALVEALRPHLDNAFSFVTHGELALAARHRATIESSTLAEQLVRDRAKDQARGATSSGPHTDDLDLQLDGRSASAFASQGEARAIVLALKIAEITLLRERLGDWPVLLLDDVSSELDPTRNRQLFDFLVSMPGQVFVTTTQPDLVLIGRASQASKSPSSAAPIDNGNRKDFQMVKGVLTG
jgi:DNA replication and repair protein RecF